jgi:hypothetical protein
VESEDAGRDDDDSGKGRYRFTLAYYPLEGLGHGPRRKS